MSEILEDSHYKWELINRLIDKNWSDENCIFSFNIDRKKEYSKIDIENLANEEGKAYSSFSDLVHQMPKSKIFEISSNLLWKEYEKIFYCTTIAKQKNVFVSNNELSVNVQWIKKYTKYENEYRAIEENYLKALENNKSQDYINVLRKRLRNKKKYWFEKGYKTLIEEKRNQLDAEGGFSFASQWSKWKSASEKSWFADVKGPNSVTGSYTANFKSIIDNNWQEISFSHKQLCAVLNGCMIKENHQGIKQLVKAVDKIKFKYIKVFIERNWFKKDIFTSGFWDWKKSYNGQWLSDGKLDGSLPSHIKEVIFLKDISFRERSGAVLDLLEWVGGGFNELNYVPFIESKEEGVFLTVFNCEKTPKCPLPDTKLIFN